MTRFLRASIAAIILTAEHTYAQTDAPPQRIAVTEAWSRAAGPGMTVGASYMTLANLSASPDRFLSAASPVATRVEIHSSSVEDGVMKMRPRSEGVVIGAGETVKLAPGGLHLMLVQLNRPLRPGETFPLTLQFERSGTVEITVRVLPLGATPK